MDFHDKVVIVTGGAQGIGRAICELFLRKGAKVCMMDINVGKGVETLEELRVEAGENIHFVKCDVSSSTCFRDAFDETVRVFGKIDILVNNAGILDEQNWRKMVDINLVGVINGVLLAFEFMSKNGKAKGGHVVNVASLAGLDGVDIIPIYCSCKHGVVGLTKSYGSEYHLNRTGVRISAVCPTAVETDMLPLLTEKSVDNSSSKERIDRLTPVGPTVIAKAVIQLLNDNRNGALLKVYHEGNTYVE